MTELIPQRNAIAFNGDFLGAESEEDLYNMLGLDYGASNDEVREAARNLMGQYHPDSRNGNVAAYQTIRQVRDILTGEAMEEPDFVDMEEYQEWREAEEFFSDDVLDERVSGLDSLMQGRFRSTMEQQRLEEALKDADEVRGTNYYERYQALQGRRPSSMREKIDIEVEREMLKAEALGRDIDEQELREAVESHFEERKQKVKEAVRERGGVYSYGTDEKYPDLVENQLTDITARGKLTFVEDREDQEFEAVPRADKDDDVVRVSMLGDSKLYRDNEVYVKMPEGKVTVEDPGLREAIQVWEGDVEIDLNTWDEIFADEPPVVRAEAPNVDVRAGYSQKGDLYVPDKREVDEDPDVDLSVEVRDGSVTLRDSRTLSLGLEDDSDGSGKNTGGLESYLDDELDRDDDPFDNIF